MQSAALQDLNREMGLLLQYNPPPRSADHKAARLCPRLKPPLMFYTKHLDAKLSLKRVQTIPLATYISQAVNHTAQSLKDKSIAVPTEYPGDLFPSQGFREINEHKEGIIDAKALAKVYQNTTALYSHTVASTLLFHVSAPGWFSILNYNEVECQGTDRLEAFNEDYALQIYDLDDDRDVKGHIDEETRAALQRVQHKYCGLAYWGFFAISDEAENVLEGMEGVALAEHFNYEICRTEGYFMPPIITGCTLDASTTGWGVPVTSLATTVGTTEVSEDREQSGAVQGHISENDGPQRRSNRSRRRNTLPSESAKQPPTFRNDSNTLWATVTVPIRANRKSTIAKMFLQRAWAQSVERDTTYIIFNCGNFERIGFRHRSSQTLFLSDLIDVPRCMSPGYGKIHIGLHLSILQDVIDRTEQQYKQDEMLRLNSRKRRRGTATSTSNKRYKTRAMVLKERREAEERHRDHEIAKREMDNRSLVLLELRYGVYNSPAPASFLRLHSVRKDTYTPQEYFSVVLTSQIAAGATGVAHRAHVELLAVDNKIRRLDVVVKLAFDTEQTKRLRHEFSIYELLTSRGVEEGIPVIYGLFEDVETDAMALLMSDVGTALATLLPDDERYDVTISEPVRAAYLRVLRAIHAAGVRHHDIRPENLMLIDDDQVAIIDFDMAKLDPSEGARRREMRHLTELLSGSYLPPNEIPSSATTPERESPGTVRIKTALDSVDEEGEDEDSE